MHLPRPLLPVISSHWATIKPGTPVESKANKSEEHLVEIQVAERQKKPSEKVQNTHRRRQLTTQPPKMAAALVLVTIMNGVIVVRHKNVLTVWFTISVS